MYACLTCTPEARTDPTKRAGICLACSYSCHDDHDLVELYTKRNFRCDCGTAKILAVRCKLDAMKLHQNDKNSYNQNFSGVYCICHRPYPDPEDNIDDEMVQCVLCEDWYHCRHLQTKLPKSNSFAEMICGDCMQRNDFLYNYVGMSIVSVDDSELDTTCDVDKSIMSTDGTVEETNKEPEAKVDELLKDEINQSIMNIIEISKSNSESNELDEPTAKKLKTESNSSTDEAICKKPQLVGVKVPGATFWSVDWRKHLCTCVKCLNEMKELKVEFLIDLEDTVQSYQEKGLTKVHETSEERAIRAFSQIDRRQQIDVLTGYNKLKENLREFLHTFAVSDVTVSLDDVNRFFRMMNEKENK